MLDHPVPLAVVVATMQCRGRPIRFVDGGRRGLPWVVLDDLEPLGFSGAVYTEALARRHVNLLAALPAFAPREIDGGIVFVAGPGLALVAAEVTGIDMTVWQRLHTAAWMQAIAAEMDADAGRAA